MFRPERDADVETHQPPAARGEGACAPPSVVLFRTSVMMSGRAEPGESLS
jgi:hypothetical protein